MNSRFWITAVAICSILRSVPARPAPVLFSGFNSDTAEKLIRMKISGDYRVAAGYLSSEKYLNWRNDNADLNERNWRMAFGPGKFNTYNPALSSRLSLVLDNPDSPVKPLFYHANVVFDPWSFTGKTSRVRLKSETGDAVEVQLRYWANTGKTVNDTFYTALMGDAYRVPELDLDGSNTMPATLNSLFATNLGYNNRATLPALAVQKTFQPAREIWAGWRQEGNEIKVFPFAYQDQAMISNDPLQLSDRHIYWEPSPWTAEWVPGNFNSGTNDFTRGRWSRDTAFVSRDGDGRMLTTLRGMHLLLDSGDQDFFEAVVASPKNLWQDYGDFTSFPGSVQKRFPLPYSGELGALYNFRFGYANGGQDSFGQMAALDGSLQPVEEFKLTLEGAVSQSKQDLLSDFQKRAQGHIWHVNASVQPMSRIKADLSYTQASNEFDPVLSSFRETRGDQFWGKHLHFTNPFKPDYDPLFKNELSWQEQFAWRVGDGLDAGRKIFRARIEGSFLDKRAFRFAEDLRNVHANDARWVETVLRNELLWKVSRALTVRWMNVSQFLPSTIAGLDPFLRHRITDDPVLNTEIKEGNDPSVHAYSLGAAYRLIEDVNLFSIMERTNDHGDFPRRLFQEDTFAVETVNGQTIRKPASFLYYQQYFPAPPYPYYNVLRVGAHYRMNDRTLAEITFTGNQNRHAGPIDDNMNHLQTTVSYVPVRRLLLQGHYAYSRVIDLARLTEQGIEEFSPHHNFAADMFYKMNQNFEVVLQYGVNRHSASYPGNYASPYDDPFRVLDTQDFIRISVQGKF